MKTAKELAAQLKEINEQKRKDLRKQGINISKKTLARGLKRVHQVRSGNKVGRNEPCPCGSCKKYKNCCAS